MIERQPSRIALAAGLAALCFAVSPVRADWLVTREGARVETKGAWKVQGKLVIFTQPNGTMSSLRVADVDLDQSALATAEAKAPPPPTVAEKKKPVMVLTERDHPPVTAEAEGSSTSPHAEEAASPSPVQVVSWDQAQQPNEAGVEIFGTLSNTSTETVTQISLRVEVLDAAGRQLVTDDAQVQDSSLAPGKTTSFRVPIPGLLHVEGVRFKVQSGGFRPRPPSGEETKPNPEPGPATAS